VFVLVRGKNLLFRIRVASNRNVTEAEIGQRYLSGSVERAAASGARQLY